MILPEHLRPLPVAELETLGGGGFVDDAVVLGVVSGSMPRGEAMKSAPREVDGFAGRRDVPVISPFVSSERGESEVSVEKRGPQDPVDRKVWAEQDWVGAKRFPAVYGAVLGMALAAAVAATAVVLEWVVPRVDSSAPVPMGAMPAVPPEGSVSPLSIEPETPVLVFEQGEAGVP
ncbi:MAG: hypothetical protein MUF31_06735 [Akkermansiaceae bacterium]|nr:hypothetical protein [Akkermansiaceae bacterium]